MEQTPGTYKVFLALGLCVFGGALYEAWVMGVPILCHYGGAEARMEQTIDAVRFDPPNEERTQTSLVKAAISVAGTRRDVRVVHYSARRILTGSVVRAWPAAAARYAAEPLSPLELPWSAVIIAACILAAGIGGAMAAHGLLGILSARSGRTSG